MKVTFQGPVMNFDVISSIDLHLAYSCTSHPLHWVGKVPQPLRTTVTGRNPPRTMDMGLPMAM